MMELLTQFDWRAPNWGLLLLIPLGLAGLARLRRHKLSAYADAALRPWAVINTGTLAQSGWRSLAWWLAWLLLALAAAGPRLPLETAYSADTTPRHHLTLMVVLDLSASMAATDIPPTRLSRARLELADMFKRLHGERVGLIVYVGQAGLLLPATDDLALMNDALAQANPDLIEAPGSNLAAALDLAFDSLKASQHRAVLLLTDGEETSLSGQVDEQIKAATERLKQANIPLFILGLGSEAGAPIPLPDGSFAEQDGQQVVSRMAPDRLRDLARSTGGRFALAADGDGDWKALFDSGIAALPGAPVAPEQARAWQELFHWPLGLSLLLFTLAALPRAGRRKNVRAMTSLLPGLILACAVVPSRGAHAAEPLTLQSAWQAYQAGRHGEALNQYARLSGYPGHLGAGAAAWQLKDYSTAAGHFKAALLLARTPSERTDALYNLGNASYGLGRWQTAVEAFQAVLAARPGNSRASANLAEALTRLGKSGRDSPMHSDLRGRRGALAEGEINLDWDRSSLVQEFEPEPDRPLIDREKQSALGARLTGEAARARLLEQDARRLESGLRKLTQLQDQPRTLLKGLLKQDQAPSGAGAGLTPW